MGERVDCANIGAVAPEGNAKAILEKLCWLAAQPKERFAFDAFSDQHSVEALKRCSQTRSLHGSARSQSRTSGDAAGFDREHRKRMPFANFYTNA